MHCFIQKSCLLSLLIFSIALTSCSSDSSSPAVATVTISGTAQAPAGSIASLDKRHHFLLATLDVLVPKAWAAVSGLTPVANASIELIRIDDDGNQIGGVLATTTSDSNGIYTLDLPSGVTASANLVVQIKNSSNQPVIRAIVSGDTVNIDPLSQYILDILINEPGLVLANLNIDSVQSLVDQVDSIDIDLSSASSIADAAVAIDNTTAISHVIDDGVGAIANISLIAGAWGDNSNEDFLLVIYPGGRYVHWQDCSGTGDGAGIEYGSYQYDGTTFTANPEVDENGGCGLSGWQSAEVSVTDSELVYDISVSDFGSLPRTWNGQPGSITGGWDVRNSANEPMALVFFQNGSYRMYQAPGTDLNACPQGGVEYGTYSYDGIEITGSIDVDSNNDCGLGEGPGSDVISVSGLVSGNQLSSFAEGFTFNRVEYSTGMSSGNGGSASGNLGANDIASLALVPNDTVQVSMFVDQMGFLPELLGTHSLDVTYGDGFSEAMQCDMHHYNVVEAAHTLHCSATRQADVYLSITSSNSSVIALGSDVSGGSFGGTFWTPESSGVSTITAVLLFETRNVSVAWDVDLTLTALP